jgi:hypothetical protein
MGVAFLSDVLPRRPTSGANTLYAARNGKCDKDNQKTAPQETRLKGMNASADRISDRGAVNRRCAAGEAPVEKSAENAFLAL